MKAEIMFYGEAWGNGAPTEIIHEICQKAEDIRNFLNKQGIPARVDIESVPSGGEVYTIAELEVPDLYINTSDKTLIGYGKIFGNKVFGGVAADVGHLGTGLNGSPIYLILVGEVKGSTLAVKKVSTARAFACTVLNAVERELKALAQAEETIADRV